MGDRWRCAREPDRRSNNVGNNVGVRGQGAIDGHEDLRLDILIGAEVLRCPVSSGSEEHQANRRLDRGALTEAVGWLSEAGL
jgi:hypothetical protein